MITKNHECILPPRGMHQRSVANHYIGNCKKASTKMCGANHRHTAVGRGNSETNVAEVALACATSALRYSKYGIDGRR